MSFLQDILNDLRTKRLWPLVLVLVAATVAVPVLLSKSAKSEPAVVPPAAAASGRTAGDLPAVSVSTSLVRSRLTGNARDPFTQLAAVTHGATTSGSTGTSGTPGTSGSNGTPAATGGSGVTPPAGTTGSTAGSGSGSPTPPTTTTTTTTPTTTTPPTTTPQPAGLTSTEAYEVTVSLTNTHGGVDTIDALERLSLLPSSKDSLLIELGVLDGGHDVLFAVQPGTVLSGPGRCTPGPLDCEILSLAQNQIESLSKPGTTTPVAEFAVTGISKKQYSSAADANKARTNEYAAGRKLLDTLALGALPLFKYEPRIGAVVDLRNLTVGGS